MLYYESPGSVLSIATVLPLVNILIVALRFSVRKDQRQPLLVDDWLTGPALVRGDCCRNSAQPPDHA